MDKKYKSESTKRVAERALNVMIKKLQNDELEFSVSDCDKGRYIFSISEFVDKVEEERCERHDEYYQELWTDQPPLCESCFEELNEKLPLYTSDAKDRIVDSPAEAAEKVAEEYREAVLSEKL
jgi:hypothetical protein|tara:strand:- start:413 stop:781 length:369 start_codon:yes stop_codon:yes gene_type:complete